MCRATGTLLVRCQFPSADARSGQKIRDREGADSFTPVSYLSQNKRAAVGSRRLIALEDVWADYCCPLRDCQQVCTLFSAEKETGLHRRSSAPFTVCLSPSVASPLTESYESRVRGLPSPATLSPDAINSSRVIKQQVKSLCVPPGKCRVPLGHPRTNDGFPRAARRVHDNEGHSPLAQSMAKSPSLPSQAEPGSWLATPNFTLPREKSGKVAGPAGDTPALADSAHGPDAHWGRIAPGQGIALAIRTTPAVPGRSALPSSRCRSPRLQRNRLLRSDHAVADCCRPVLGRPIPCKGVSWGG